MRVVVCGSSVSGLSSVCQLLRVNSVKSITLIDPSLHEFNPRLLQGYTGLWSPALRCMKDLGILSSIEKAGRYIGVSGYKSSHQVDSGRWLMKPSIMAPNSEDLTRPSLLFISNAELISILYSKMLFSADNSLDLQSSRLSGVDEANRTVTTSAGGTIAYDLLIAADGAHSTVRSLIGHPVQLQYRGYHVYRGHISAADADHALKENPSAADTLINQAWQTFGPGCRFAVVPTTDGFQWYAAVTSLPPSSATTAAEIAFQGALQNNSRSLSAADHTRLSNAIKGFHSPVEALVRNTTNVTVCPAYSTTTASAPPKGSSICYAGDANWTLDPILAVGAGIAVEDSWLLKSALARPIQATEVASAVDLARRDRLQILSVLSDLAQSVGHMRSPLACSIRDGLLGALPHSVTTAVLDAVIKQSVASKVCV